MAESLAKSLRPRSFVEMFGQQKITSNIRKLYERGREPSAFLFSGETGSGKTTIGRIVGVSLNCRHQPADKFGNPCHACYRNRKQYGIYEVNAAVYSGVDAVKELAAQSEFAPLPPSRRRILIMDEAQMLTKQAQNVLLKYFEDAPRTTVWIICTTEPNAIIPALRGRCKAYSLYPLAGAEAEKFVHWAAKKGSITRKPLDDFIEIIHKNGITSPRNILQALEKFEDGLDPDVAVFGSESAVDTKRLCRFLMEGEWKPVRAELEKATPSDSRLIKGAILGYLRVALLNPRPRAKLDLVAWAIDLVGRTGYSDDHTSAAQLASACYQIAKKFPG